MKRDTSIEMTLRAVVEGKTLSKVKLPGPLKLSRKEAETVAVWARSFSGTFLMEMEIHVGDIRPSSGLMVISDLSSDLARKIRPLLIEARRYGFGLRIMRDTANDPYELTIIRRTIDVPQLTITTKALYIFLDALGFMAVKKEYGTNDLLETTVGIESFAQRLNSRYTQCMDAGVAHYREHCQRIVEYGLANMATQIVWGPERRGAVPMSTQENDDESDVSAAA